MEAIVRPLSVPAIVKSRDYNWAEMMHNFHESLDRSHIRLLLALRDSGQLGKAAEVLSITPSAASHRLKEAERRLGVSLSEPDGRSIKLNAAGMHLANVGAISEASLRSAEDAARWLSSAVRPTVRLAAGFYDCAPWYRDFGADESLGFRVDVVRVRYGDEVGSVDRRVADLAVQLRPDPVFTGRPSWRSMVPWSRSSEEPDLLVAHDELVGVVPLDHPGVADEELGPAHLRGATYLTAGQGPTTGFEHSEFMAPNDAYPGDIVQIESVSLILDLVAAGRGLTIQPRLAVERAAADRDLGLLPLAGTTVSVRWEAVPSPHSDRVDDAMSLVQALQRRYREPVG